MKVQFCDLCNESVPQSDLDQGRAVERKGRIVCFTCERAMSHSASGAFEASVAGPFGERQPGEAQQQAFESAQNDGARARLHDTQAVDPLSAAAASAALPAAHGHATAHAIPATSKATGAAGLWFAVVALIASALAIVVVDSRLRRLDESLTRIERAQARDAQAIAQAQAVARELVAGERALEQRQSARFDEQRQRFESALAELRVRGASQEQQLAQLVHSEQTRREAASNERLEDERRIAELVQRITRGEDDQRLLVERLASLEAHPKPAEVGAPAVAANGAGAAGAAKAPGWTALLADLSSPSEARRWEAVDGLGQTHDVLVVPHLIPMLKDVDVFVRMATARVLGDLQATAAVPNLIDALEDTQEAVREAALVALRTITGKDLRFDPLANEAERAKKVKAWRDWWKKAEEEGGVGRG